MSGHSITQAANRENLRLLILLRWIAVAGQVATIAVVGRLMGLPLPYAPMFGAVGLLVIWNIGSSLRWRSERPVTTLELFAQLLVDVLMLTIQLYLSGGATNPFVSLFLLHVILGAVLLDTRRAAALTAVTTVAFMGLAVVHEPLNLSPRANGQFLSLHVLGVFLCFLLTAGLLLFFLARIAANQRARDLRLAELRQRAAEEDHVVRMGLLAAGAAHELGTPLATLSVILNDWGRLKVFRQNPDAQVEMSTMTAQLERCKAIVSGILQASGELRGEGTIKTTIRRFLDQSVSDWQALRATPGLAYDNRFEPDVAIVSDAALMQVVTNLLDNALEAGAATRGLTARRMGERLEVVVWDDGPGFDGAVLERFGQPYVSTKGKAGRGLGLFLVSNVVRKLGGTVTAENRVEGGAAVTLRLPLAAFGATE